MLRLRQTSPLFPYTPLFRSRARLRPHAPRHDDLFQRRIAGTLTDAVDGAFDLPGPGLDRGERVGHREPEVVMAVRAEHDAVGVRNTLVHGAEHRSVLDG